MLGRRNKRLGNAGGACVGGGAGGDTQLFTSTP